MAFGVGYEQMNLREIFHVVELRSARQGHPSYRKVAQQIYKTTVSALPWLRDLIRVDMKDYENATACMGPRLVIAGR